jgi:hypothetical protein
MTKRFRLQEVDDVFYIIDGKYSTGLNQYRLTPKNIVNLLNSFDETLEYFYNISSDGELIKELHEENQMLKELLYIHGVRYD